VEEADLNEFIVATMPYFIAVNYQHLLEAQKPRERVHHMIYLYDLVLRTVTITIVSQYLGQERSRVNDPHLNDLLLNQFPTHFLTLDTWQKIFFIALRAYEGKKKLFFMPELYDFYWDTSGASYHPRRDVEQTFEDLTQLALEVQSEKDLPRDEAGWASLAQEVKDLLETLLSGLAFLGRYELIRVLDVDSTSYRYELHKGLTIVEKSQSLPEHHTFRQGYFYVRRGAEDFLGLHPLLIFWEGEMKQEKPTAPDTAIYDHLIGDEELQFLLSLSDKVIKDDDQRIVKAFLWLLREIGMKRPGEEGKPLSWLQLVETCAEITQRRMATVRGKFRKELYLQREQTRQEFERFLQSDRHCFVLIGKSGVGKSNFLLAAEEELRHSRTDLCILMYDGAKVGVEQTLTGIISQDVGNHLHHPVQNIWHEIDRLGGMQGRTVLLCVDAINENPQATRLLEQLDELVQDPWPWLKVVFSCRPETWRSIKRGVKLAEALYYRGQDAGGMEVELEAFGYSEQMEDFTRQELAQAYVKYQRGFHLQTAYESLSPAVRETLREPLNLWLVASTYSNRTIPPTLKVAELVEHYIDALVDTQRLEPEDLELLEEQLVPLLFREGHYSNEITGADIESGGKKLRLTIFSEQVRRNRSGEQEQQDQRQINQSFVNLLEADILVRQRQGREQKIAFKYERFYEYFVGKRIVQVSAGQANRASFFVTLIDATSSTPFLWGAVRNALAQEVKERGPALLVILCHTDKQRVKEMLASVLVYLGQDDLQVVDTLLRSLMPVQKKAGELRKIQQARGKGKPVEGTDLKTRNARKIAIEVAGRLKLGWVLDAAALEADSTIRAAGVRASYYLWQHDRAAGFEILEHLAEQATAGLVPNFQVFESVVGLSIIIFSDHYRDADVLHRLQGIWHGMIARLFRLHEGSSRWRAAARDFIREQVISFAISLVFRLFRDLPAYSMVSYEAFEAFFQFGTAEKALYRNLVSYLDVDGEYSREQMERDYLAALKIDNVLVSLTALMGLSAHACAAPHDFLPFLKQLFEAAKSDVATYPYLTTIANAVMDVLEHDPMLDDMFDFFVYAVGVLHECYAQHPETYHNRLAEAPQAAAMHPYMLAQYRRTGTVRTAWLEALIQAELAENHLKFFELFLTTELPQVGIEKQEPRAALMVVDMFFSKSNAEIKQMIMEFLARLYVYYPDEVEDFLEEQQAPHEFRLQVRTSESAEKVGDLIGKRPWYFALDGVLLGPRELRSQLLLFFKRATEAKNTQAWMDFMIRRLVNVIYGGEALRQPD
jgi:hypothetical protein